MNWLMGHRADDRHARLTGTALLVVALGLTAWIFYLGAALPNQGPVQDWGTSWTGIGTWQLTWVGLDVFRGRRARRDRVPVAPRPPADAYRGAARGADLRRRRLV